jgi:AcrR family transcriptional regulator
MARSYNSPLRAGQAEQTREQILDGLIQAMARDGIADLSIPVVAREAGVSIATVYRYFPTKRALMSAVVEYAHRKGSFEIEQEFPALGSPDDIADIVPLLFKRREGIDPTVFAALGSAAGYTVRRPLLKARRAYFSKVISTATNGLSRAEKEWFHDIVFVLTSSTTARAFKDYLDLDSDEAAKRVAWALRKLSRGARPGAKGSNKAQ